MRTEKMILIIVLSFLSGCVTLTQSQITSIDYNPATMEIVGNLSGESNSVKGAIKDAISTTHAQILINASIDCEVKTFLWIVYEKIIKINGIGVKIKNNTNLDILDMKKVFKTSLSKKEYLKSLGFENLKDVEEDSILNQLGKTKLQ